jgi:peptidyl-prolyl cis-trans isomerase A (cyclophilin A)
MERMMRIISRSSLGLMAALLLCVVVANAPSANAGTLVTINTNLGEIQVDLYGDVAPTTVSNFASLVTGGNYTDTIVHRSVSNFVIQGGGFNLQNSSIANNGNIALEYRMLNTRGTIAMARTNAPDTANSQWFINTADNTTTLAPRADNPATPQNEFSAGYAAFGWVVSGMNVVDAIAALPKFNFASLNSAFNELPVQNYTQANYNASVPLTNANKVVINGITVAETHPSYQNPIWDADVNNSGTLTAADIMPIVNGLLTQNGRFTPSADNVGTTYKYWDTNGDSSISVSDLMRVVNAILRGDTAPANPFAAPLAAPLTAVPEPSTFALITMAIVATVTLAFRRRRSRSAA